MKFDIDEEEKEKERGSSSHDVHYDISMRDVSGFSRFKVVIDQK